jgi:hypothetical protein
MAKSAIPNPLDRRHLIEKNLSEAQALETAEAYLAAGRPVEAVEFLTKAEARDRLAELRSQAIESGDAFLLRAVARAMGEAATRAEWSALAEAADAAGKDRYAADARRQLEREDDG